MMCGNASCILYFKQNINTHVKNYVLADTAIDGPTTDDDDVSIAESTDTSR